MNELSEESRANKGAVQSYMQVNNPTQQNLRLEGSKDSSEPLVDQNIHVVGLMTSTHITETTMFDWDTSQKYICRMKLLCLIFLICGSFFFSYAVGFFLVLIQKDAHSDDENDQKVNLQLSNYILEAFGSTSFIVMGILCYIVASDVRNVCRVKTLNIAAKVEICIGTLTTFALAIIQYRIYHYFRGSQQGIMLKMIFLSISLLLYYVLVIYTLLLSRSLLSALTIDMLKTRYGDDMSNRYRSENRLTTDSRPNQTNSDSLNHDIESDVTPLKESTLSQEEEPVKSSSNKKSSRKSRKSKIKVLQPGGKYFAEPRMSTIDEQTERSMSTTNVSQSISRNERVQNQGMFGLFQSSFYNKSKEQSTSPTDQQLLNSDSLATREKSNLITDEQTLLLSTSDAIIWNNQNLSNVDESQEEIKVQVSGQLAPEHRQGSSTQDL